MSAKRFAVIGHPIGHTMSPFLHGELFALAGESGEYGSMDISPPSLAAAMKGLRELSGFNVTIPHKTAVIPFLDALSKRAELYGSVNTVKNEGGRLVGHTTDGEGFLRALQGAGVPFSGSVLILGAGGVSRVMLFEAMLHAPPGTRVAVAARTREKAEELCAQAAALAKDRGFVPSLQALSLAELEQNAKTEEWELLCNGTPVGMYPRGGETPVSEAVVESCAAVFDAVYNPHETVLLRLAERHGKKTVHGIDMLVWQAAAAQEIWFGTRFSPEAMSVLHAKAVAELCRRFGVI